MKKLFLNSKLFSIVFLANFTTIMASAASSVSIKRLPVENKYSELLWSFENYGQPYRIDNETFGQPGKAGADIQLLKAWSVQSEATDVKIAVIDADFDLEHPDLKNVFDVAHSWNFITNQGPIKSPTDELPHHGTMVAGVIGADGFNEIGITGILRKSHIIPIQALPDSGDEDDRQIAQAINYAVYQGAKIINLSFGKFNTTEIVEQAIRHAQKNNVLIVASAGNGRNNVDEKSHWPSSYSVRFDNVISVAATNRSDRLYSESNYGSSIDIAAPGHEIFSTGNPVKPISKYSSFSGTSAAVPHVTGVAALMLAKDPNLRPGQIKEILIRTVDPINSTNGYQPRFGRLNAYRALSLVQRQNNSWTMNNYAGTSCDLNLNKKEYLRSKSKVGYRWELTHSPELFLPWQTQDMEYGAYYEWISSHNPGDFRAILQTHINAGRKILERLDPREELAKSILEDEKLVLSIIQGFHGKVNSMNCMESIVFREFLKSNKQPQSKKEFTANIFQEGKKIIILAEWDTEEDDSGFIGAVESSQLKSERSKLIAKGWHLFAHYHNHPFNFENRWGDIGGGLAPSDADLATYKSLKPTIALITNGIDTIRFEENFWSPNKP